MKVECFWLILPMTAKYAFVYTHKAPPNGRRCLDHPPDAAASPLRPTSLPPLRNLIRTDCHLDRARRDSLARASHVCMLDKYLATRASRYSQGITLQAHQLFQFFQRCSHAVGYARAS